MTDSRVPANEALRPRGLPAALSILLLGLGCWLLWVRFNQAVELNVPYPVTPVDLINYYIPMTRLAAERLGAGQLPMWNETACCGIPFLATLQTAVFYPPTWLAIWIPSEDLLPGLAFAHLIAGGAFAALLFRSWACPWPAAALGSLVFVRTVLLGQTMWPPAVATLTWIPWLALCAYKVARNGSTRWWVGFVLGVALQLAAGFPQLLVYGYGVVIPVALAGMWQQRAVGATPIARRLAALTIAIALGGGLAAIQLIPTAELVSQSARVKRLTPEQVHYLTVPAGRQDSAAVLRASFDPSVSHVTLHYRTGYLGAAVLALSLAALLARRREPLPWLLLIVSGIALVLSDGYFGEFPGFYALYAKLPLVGDLRTPERLRLIPYTAAAALTALGATSLANARGRERLVLGAACVIGALPLAVAPAFGIGSGLGGSIRSAAAITLCLAVLSSSSRPVKSASLILLLAFSLWDLRTATAPTTWMRDIPDDQLHSYYWLGGVLAPQQFETFKTQVGDRRTELVYLPFVGSGRTGGVDRPSCYEPLVPEQWAALHLRLFGEETTGMTLLADPIVRETAFYRIASVGGVVHGTGDGTAHLRVEPGALPRAFFASRYHIAERSEIFDHIANSSFDFRNAVFLERDPGVPQGKNTQIRRLERIEQRPERVVISVVAPEPGLVVSTDTHYPGWRATVDGEPAVVLVANGLHRAVSIPAGEHEVVFEYRPASIRAGFVVSLTSAAILGIVVVRTARRKLKPTLSATR